MAKSVQEKLCSATTVARDTESAPAAARFAAIEAL